MFQISFRVTVPRKLEKIIIRKNRWLSVLFSAFLVTTIRIDFELDVDVDFTNLTLVLLLVEYDKTDYYTVLNNYCYYMLKISLPWVLLLVIVVLLLL